MDLDSSSLFWITDMSDIANVSQSLGDFLLKGYVLTDQSCPTPGCAIPLLRTPRGISPDVTFCVKCSEGQAQDLTQQSLSNVPPEAPSSSQSPTLSTEFSRTRISPVVAPLLVYEEIRQRRGQSDLASSEIGKKLLQGWTMLGDECPCETCYGIPLVRPPRSVDNIDPRKECVVCGTTFTTKIDSAGRGILIAYGTKRAVNTGVGHESHPVLQKDKPTILPVQPVTPDSLPPSPPQKRQKIFSPSGALLLSPQPHISDCHESPDTILDDTSEALQVTLRALSSQLRTLSSQAILDSSSIGVTADAIYKVTQTLGLIRTLQSDKSRGKGFA